NLFCSIPRRTSAGTQRRFPFPVGGRRTLVSSELCSTPVPQRAVSARDRCLSALDRSSIAGHLGFNNGPPLRRSDAIQPRLRSSQHVGWFGGRLVRVGIARAVVLARLTRDQ